jgi:hypothetical protein
MSEHDGERWAFPIDEPVDAYEVALHEVCYRTPEVALETFSMLEALRLVLESVRTGVPYDQKLMDRLREAFARDDEPEGDQYYDDEGFLVTEDMDGNVISRDPSSPEMMRFFREEKERKLTTEAYVAKHAPIYVERLLGQLAGPEATQGTVSVLIERGRREGEVVSQNELEQAALGDARKSLIEQGYAVKEENRSVGADGSSDHPKSERTHTLRTLIVSRVLAPTEDL